MASKRTEVKKQEFDSMFDFGDREYETIDKSELKKNTFEIAKYNEREQNVTVIDDEVSGIIRGQYDEYTRAFAIANEDEQINILARMHSTHESMEYIIGKCMKILDAKIMSGKMREYSSVRDYIKKHYRLTGINERKAYRCMQLVDTVDEKTFLKIGIRKALILASIEDEDIREVVAKEAVKNPEVTVAAFEIRAKEIIKTAEPKGKTKEEIAREKRKNAIDEYMRVITFNVVMNGSRQVVVDNFKAKRIRDLYIDAIAKREAEIKKEIAEILYNEKYPIHK